MSTEFRAIDARGERAPAGNGAPVAIGVVGLGRSGWGIHATYLAKDPNYRLVAVADPMEERRTEAIEKLGVARAYATPEELFADPEVELVVVATPSHTHKELAIKALRAGKHVQVEKPFALNAGEADEMIRTASECGRIVTCFQNRRADPDFLAIRSLIDSGKLGRVFLIRMGNYKFERRRDWQTLISMGGGMLNNWGAHKLDQALIFLNGEYDGFFCDLKRTVSAGDAEDHVKVALKGKDGLVVEVEIFSACPMPLDAWVVIGERGMARGSGSSITVQWYPEGALPPIEADPGAAKNRAYGTGETVPWQTEVIEVPRGTSQTQVVYDRLWRSIRLGEPLFVTPESVRSQLALLDRCRATYTPEGR